MWYCLSKKTEVGGKMIRKLPEELLRVIMIVIIIAITSSSLVGRVFTNGPGDRGSIPSRVIPKTLKMVLDTSLLHTQHYKVCIEGKVEQSREKSSALPYASV